MPFVIRLFPSYLKAFTCAAFACAALVNTGSLLHAAEVTLGTHTFTLPDGFQIEQVAGAPLVDRPICADFDEQGRLYVADSSGSNEKIQIQLEKKPHRIVRLEDTNGDGRFDKSSVFADKMMFPEGALWHAGSLYVSAPPVIWKLTDTNGDGTADRREEWFDGKTLTGCANDLHGPYLGPDGWIYWCKGAFAEQTYERPGKKPLVTRAAHIFRRRPEGGLIESVMTGGMDNPVEVVFTPGGERIFTTTFLQHPGGGLRDGLIHAVYGGVYGKMHGVLEGHPRTGPIMPVLSHLGAAAPCGLVRLQSDEWGSDYKNNVFACLFNMHKLTRHRLKKKGATFETDNEDFLVSDNLDFHPTDVIEDADGSLLVINTGGWYKLCCPTSQLWKPDILGGIYRIRRKGSRRIADARGLKIDWPAQTNEQLVALLGDKRIAVGNRARQTLGRRGGIAVGSLEHGLTTSSDARHRRRIVWALTHIADSAARRAVRRALSDENPTVRQAALHSISVRKDREAETDLIQILRTASPHNRRVAAEALGRVGTSRAVPALLDSAAESPGRVLEHSIIYALLEIADADQTRMALKHNNSHVRRAALLALSQMPDGKLGVNDVRPLLDSDDPLLRETAWWITEQHLDWAGELAGYFQTAISQSPDKPEALNQLSTRLALFAGNQAVQETIAEGLSNSALNRNTQSALINAILASRLNRMPAVWSKPLLDHLATRDSQQLEAVVKAVAKLSGSKLNEAFIARLRQIARVDALPVQVRLQALVAVPGKSRQMNDGVLRFLCDHLDIEKPVHVRALAVDVLLSTPLNIPKLEQVADAVASTGPMELKRLMERFAKSRSADVGRRLVASLEQCPSASSLLPDQLKQQLTGFGEEVLKQAEPLLKRIEQENKDKLQTLVSILKLVDKGDIRSGQRVFQNTKTACAACHAMGYLGGRIGPDLTRIGRIRSERDILESILFPSASLVRSYEPSKIATSDGHVYSGIIRDETSTHITLQIDAQKTVRIAVADIEERLPGDVSIMPRGLEKQLTPQQLADLVAFLKATK